MSESRVAAGAAEGSIYDLGYRHYEGRRLGRRYAFYSLFVDSLRSVWGFGRPTRAKAAPFIIVGLYALPAFFQLAFSAVIAQQIQRGESVTLFSYGNYFSQLNFFMVLLCIAQAPELVCRDQRYHVLPLYFTRALERLDYSFAKIAALSVALFIALLVPLVAIFVGDVLMKSDALAALGTEWPKALPAIPGNAIIAIGMATVSLALSSFSPRRAYSAIGLVAFFLLMESVPTAIYEIGVNAPDVNWAWASNLLLLRPVSILTGASDWIFGNKPAFSGDSLATAVSPESQALASVVMIILAVGILTYRYRRIAA